MIWPRSRPPLFPSGPDLPLLLTVNGLNPQWRKRRGASFPSCLSLSHTHSLSLFLSLDSLDRPWKASKNGDKKNQRDRVPLYLFFLPLSLWRINWVTPFACKFAFRNSFRDVLNPDRFFQTLLFPPFSRLTFCDQFRATTMMQKGRERTKRQKEESRNRESPS